MKFHKGVEFKLTGERNRFLRLEGTIQGLAAFGALAALSLWIYISRTAGPAEMNQTAMNVLSFIMSANVVFIFLARALRDLWMRIEKHSASDPLTGIMNHECFERMLEGEMRRAGRYHYPLAVCILDLDGVASYNQQYGLEKGDALLRRFAEFLNGNIRFADCAARYDRDEFVLYLPHTDLVQAQKFLTRFLIQSEERLDYGFCAGVTVLHGGEKRSQLMLRAQTALQQAKRAGKKQIRGMTSQQDHPAVVTF